MSTFQEAIEPEPPPIPRIHKFKIELKPELPPPSPDKLQLVDDVYHSASINMLDVQEQNSVFNRMYNYSPHIRKFYILGTQNTIHHKNKLYGYNCIRDFILLTKQNHKTKSHSPPPNNHPIHIPTPKSKYNPPTFHDITWRDFVCKNWSKNATGGWDIPPPDASSQVNITLDI